MQRRHNHGTPLTLALLLLGLLFVLFASQNRRATAQETTIVHLPIVNMAGTVVDSVLVRGLLMADGAPLANARFEVRTCSGEEGEVLATGESDDAGAIELLIPVAGGASTFEAKVVYPATGAPPLRGTLASFESVCITNHGASLTLPAIELAVADFTSPAKAAAVDMPILFAWQPRNLPGADEMYQVVGTILYDCATCEPVTITAAALPHPSSSILLECVYSAHSTVISGAFRVMVSNATGVGYSDTYAFDVGRTERC